MHPAYKRLSDRFNGKIPKSVTKKLKSKGLPVYNGDVVVKTLGPDHVFPEVSKSSMKDIDHIEYIEWVHVEELRAQYPSLRHHIRENKRDFYDYEFTELTRPQNYVMVRHFFHRHTEALPQGDYVKYTERS